MSSSFPAPSALFTQVPRRRWGARFAQFAPMRFFLGILLLTPAAALEIFAGQRADPSKAALLLLSTGLYAASLLAFACVVERRRPAEWGLRLAAREWFFGLSLGSALLSVTVAVVWGTGAYHVAGGGSPLALLTGLMVFVPHALFEEALFRFLLFKVAEEALGTWSALVLGAAFFGFVHLANPGASWVGAVAIALEAGVLLTACFMFTRRVWLVWGVHVGWNLAQGSLFGIRVSGTPLGPSWLISTPTGPSWWTGGDFGIEASPVAVVCCVGVASWLLHRCAREGRILHFNPQRERVAALKRGTTRS